MRQRRPPLPLIEIPSPDDDVIVEEVAKQILQRERLPSMNERPAQKGRANPAYGSQAVPTDGALTGDQMRSLLAGQQVGRTELLLGTNSNPNAKGGVSASVALLSIATPENMPETFHVGCMIDWAFLENTAQDTRTIRRLADTIQIPVKGIVEWGGGGVNQRAEFDWLMGCSFSVSGSYLRLSALTERRTSGGFPNQDIRVGSWISLKSQHRHGFPPQRTLRSADVQGALASPDNLAPGEQVILTLPIYTYEVEILNSNLQPLEVDLMGAVTSVLSSQVVGAGAQAVSMPLAQRISRIAIRNIGGATTSYGVICKLAL